MRKQLRLRTVFQTKAVSLLEMPILRETFSEFPGFSLSDRSTNRVLQQIEFRKKFCFRANLNFLIETESTVD